MRDVLKINGYGTDCWVLIRETETILGEYGEPNSETRQQVYKLLYNPDEFICKETGEIIWYSNNVLCSHFLDDIMDAIHEIISCTKSEEDFNKWCNRHNITRITRH